MARGRLTGRRVLVTRPRERAAALVAGLEAEGADVILVPMIEVTRPEDPGPLEAAAARLGDWDWVVFTSVYAVRALRAALERVEPANASEVGPRCACVGAGTAAAARRAGWAPEVVPDDASATGLVGALTALGEMDGARVLFPRASDARDVLAAGLRAAGATVDEVVAYRKVAPEAPVEAVAGLLREGVADALTFTSPSTVRNFVRLLGRSAGDAKVVVIGQTTAAAAEAAGLRVSAVAESASSAGLVEAVVRAFKRTGSNDDVHG